MNRPHLHSRAALTSLLLVAIASLGCVTLNLLPIGRSPLVERVVQGSGDDKLLMIQIQGAITETDEPVVLGLDKEGTAARVREELDAAREDSAVRGILLRIDSPGGTATASDIIYDEIRRFKSERDIPVVAQFMGTAASGGYYVAMAADEVRAHPTSVTGSIGVIFVGANIVGLMDKLGIENQTLVAGKHKDAGFPLRRMSRDERAHLQSVLDDLHDRFKGVVDAGRPELSAAQVERLADGSIYSAPQALENGLIDAVGSLEDAIASLEARAGLTEAEVITYARRSEYRKNIYTEAPMRSPEIRIDLSSLLGPMGGVPGFHYLWWPGN